MEDFLDPEVPKKLPWDPSQEEGERWSAIDRLSPWDCLFSLFGALDEVPRQHRPVFGWAYGVVLERLERAAVSQSEEEEERALKWLLFLSQALLRSPCKGGVGGRGLVAKRFNSLAERRWGDLVEEWEADRDKYLRESRTRPDISPEEEEDRTKKELMRLLGDGNISKVADRIRSSGVGDMEDPRVRHEMQEKHPPRVKEFEGQVKKQRPVEDLKGLKDKLLGLRAKKGSSPGVGGCRQEYLVTLAEVLHVDKMQLLENFGLRYLGAEYKPWFYRVFLSTRTVALYKDADQESVRPLGIRHSLVRALHSIVVTENKPELRDFCEPEQLALSPGGCSKLYIGLRSLLEARRDFTCIKLDCKNAFNSCCRVRILQVYASTPSLAHMSAHVAATLAPSTVLEDRGLPWGEARCGCSQGEPRASPDFCISWQEFVVELNAALAPHGGMARFLMDDGYACGPSNILFPAIQRFEEKIMEECNLALQRSKCEVFTWSGERPEGCIPGFLQAGEEVDGRFESGFVCVGAPLGTDRFVGEVMRRKVEELRVEANRTVELLGEEKQALWTVLRASFSHKLEYWLGLLYPSQVEEAATEMDSLCLGLLEHVCGSHLPSAPGSLSCPCCNTVEGVSPGIPGLPQHTTFQSLIKELPIKLGGMGLRSQRFLSTYAYYGTLEQAIPHFAVVCPPLAHLAGEDLSVDMRWAPLLTSGCRAGEELLRAWHLVREEADSLAGYLEEELPFYHSSTVEGLGEGSKNGSSRPLMVKEMEKLRADALDKALKEFPDKTSRMVMVRKNADKLSFCFLLDRPGPHSGIASIHFSERILTLLAVPSVLCRGKVGQRVGKLKVDKWGDSVLNATIPGPHTISGHNLLKDTMNSLFRYCGILSEVEPYGVFGDLVPQLPLNRIQAGQARQLMIPDIRADIPDETGGSTKSTLIEVKTVSGLTAWYLPVTAEDRAVEKRVKEITREYAKEAKKADLKFFKTENGPVTMRLAQVGPILGMAWGRMGEASKSVHTMVEVMARAKVRQQNLAWGRGEELEKGDYARQVTYIRRRISSASVTAFGRKLASRMAQVGQGAALATGRRQQWGREEEWARRAREADWLEKVSARGLVHRGRFWTK